MNKKTLFDKIWDSHLVSQSEGQPDLIYIDLHLVHEVTSPQAFENLRLNQRSVRRPSLTVATIDHNVPTINREKITDPIAKKQIEVLRENCQEFNINLYDINSSNQGIVHVIGPELGLTQPGMTIVCGDSHTSTHGAFGTLAFGIGTSEVEHVLATQTLIQRKPKKMEIRTNGDLPIGVSPKDLVLAIIGKIGVAGGTGHAIEYTGDAIRNMSMEGRMTVCNMTIEGGGRAGMISPDEITYEYLEGKKFIPNNKDFKEVVDYWDSFKSDSESEYDSLVEIDSQSIEPMVTWGTNPGQVTQVSGKVPDPLDFIDSEDQENAARAIEYMGLEPNMLIEDIKIDRVFLGSCTNARIEDLRSAAKIIKGRKVSNNVNAMVVPGSMIVKIQAEKEGLDGIFKDSGFEWREAGCSMCLGMNPDILIPGERCASTSNRNFEGRQGKGGRTHLVSPEMAAAAAIKGHFTDIRNWNI
ncbi:MAG: 3-isopropylmalate dehydratase large subunit [Chloroflexi bacterium]|nr:3-isopropylmalate dehydratase large subunit [Chloroflexota bacterium]